MPVCWLAEEKKADLVEAILGLGWIYAETKETGLELITKIVRFIEQGLMDYQPTIKGKKKGDDAET
eukprot:11176768-Heterocapsa_arctica.AAC.1